MWQDMHGPLWSSAGFLSFHIIICICIWHKSKSSADNAII